MVETKNGSVFKKNKPDQFEDKNIEVINSDSNDNKSNPKLVKQTNIEGFKFGRFSVT